uniref:membrane-associated phosphatidylinositol transfer protein 2-like isoform X2 n=1 Tax=Panthera onca TaxID=9690 RepID=UPI002955D6E3|nr:membrane-associated phosphatidylinositol transfer protein 2-like isoform X2 [Panthera onca]
MVRAHRQAWCWQDEWYGLNMENIRELEKEAQLMLSRKMARFNEDDEEAVQLAKDEAIQAQVAGEPAQPSSSSSSSGEPLAGRGLKKQWSTSSKSSRSSKRGASPSRHSISEWRMQSIARDSDEGSEDEYFDAHGRRWLLPGQRGRLWAVLEQEAWTEAAVGQRMRRNHRESGVSPWPRAGMSLLGLAGRDCSLEHRPPQNGFIQSDGGFFPYVSLFPQAALPKHDILQFSKFLQ